ncbi:MAG: DUF4468 domain-containing protein [Mediterranea sp.]|jgi:hypothetical protein|nr:DUF4468 domain-containing protein [Mediterranea sp.]
MKKFTILFLTLLFVLPMATQANTAKDRDDSRYLAGAVPEVDGKVVFSKEIQVAGMSRQQIYDTLLKWLTERLKENKNLSRVVYTDAEKGIIAGLGEEWIVFSSSALSLDRTLINYQVTVTCQEGSCLVELEKIRFTYRDTEKYTAEEWITDKYALNKAKTKLVRGLAKWRRKTVDFADDLFMDVAVELGARDTRPRDARKKNDDEAKAAPTVEQAAAPIVIAQGNLERPQPVKPVKIAREDAVTPAQPASSAQPEYAPVDLKQIPGDVYALMGSARLVISIGTDEFNMTNMTANAGGAIGFLAGKAVAYCNLAPDQPYDVMEKASTYTLKLYPQGQTTPQAIIECVKLPQQAAPQAGQPRTYVGEITKLSLKK